MDSMNTLLISVDALRPDHLGQYGYSRDTMPVLDRLIDEGLLYENAYANGAHTRTSIPSFLSSRIDGFSNLHETPTIGTVLSRHNTETFGVHSNAHLTNLYGDVAGFDDYLDFSDDSDEWQAAENSWLGKAYDFLVMKAGTTFAKSETLKSVHERVVPSSVRHTPSPYVKAEQITDEILDWFKEHECDETFVWAHYMDPHRPYGLNRPSESYVSKNVSTGEILELMAKAGETPGEVSSAEVELIVDLYDSDLRYLSRHLTRLFDGLSEMGLFENMDIYFFADHGEEFGEHGLFYHRNLPYEELVRVPLVFKSDVVSSGTCEDQRQLLDICPTVLERHSVPQPPEFSGDSLLEPTDNPIVATRINSNKSVDVAVCKANWKLIDVTSGIELYDLETDPTERDDVADDNEATVEALRDHIPDEVHDGSRSIATRNTVDGKAQQRLENLGYLE